jgi:hypothetical protein
VIIFRPPDWAVLPSSRPFRVTTGRSFALIFWNPVSAATARPSPEDCGSWPGFATAARASGRIVLLDQIGEFGLFLNSEFCILTG